MRFIILSAPLGYRDTVAAILENHEVSSLWWEPASDHDELFAVRFLTGGDDQPLLDELEKCLGSAEKASMHIMKVDSSFPNHSLADAATSKLTRDELLRFARQGARGDMLFVLLVALSTLVAAIGLLKDNVAVVIGAMVIAPLLGPNLAAALGAALGDFQVVRRATLTFLSGIVIAFGLSLLIGIAWPEQVISAELLSRTDIGIDSSLLALASGAAGVLSLTSGVPAVLVGVMVAVALLPPLATCGILLAWGDVPRSAGALLLFVINVAAINLAAHVTLYFASVQPRTPAMATLARRNSLLSSFIWLVIICVLTWIWLR